MKKVHARNERYFDRTYNKVLGELILSGRLTPIVLPPEKEMLADATNATRCGAIAAMQDFNLTVAKRDQHAPTSME